MTIEVSQICLLGEWRLSVAVSGDLSDVARRRRPFAGERFTFLAANVLSRETEGRSSRRHESGTSRVRVGFIGAVTRSTLAYVVQSGVAGIRFVMRQRRLTTMRVNFRRKACRQSSQSCHEVVTPTEATTRVAIRAARSSNRTRAPIRRSILCCRPYTARIQLRARWKSHHPAASHGSGSL